MYVYIILTARSTISQDLVEFVFVSDSMPGPGPVIFRVTARSTIFQDPIESVPLLPVSFGFWILTFFFAVADVA